MNSLVSIDDENFDSFLYPFYLKKNLYVDIILIKFVVMSVVIFLYFDGG